MKREFVRSRQSWLSALFVACAAILGCASGLQITGQISSAAGPLPGADIAMDCPQAIKASGTSHLVQSGEGGTISFREPAAGRWIHNECELIVSKEGYQTANLGVEDVCQQYQNNHCVRVALDVALEPSTEPQPAM